MSEEIKENQFKEFGLKKEIFRGVERAGFKEPSPIQALSIPVILEGHDLVAQAHTGTGKTAAFGLGSMNQIDKNGGVQLLVITPTRELANQVSDELFMLGKFANLNTVTVYGGQSYQRQLKFLQRGAQIVVATPGRLLDLLKSGKLEDFNPSIVTLDEADEMLDMGFLDDINEIFEYLPSNRQTLLFSATMPEPIKELANRILSNPEFISVTKKEVTASTIEQRYYVIEEKERDEALVRLIDIEEPSKSVVFCRMKREVDRLGEFLRSQGYKAVGLHGDMEQRERERVIKEFKQSRADILVATDVAARGLDMKEVTFVFNYHIPFDPESYVHRIGRTGRAGKDGTAITLVTPLEFRELQKIQKITNAKLELHEIGSGDDSKTFDKIVSLVKKQKLHSMSADVLLKLEEEMAISKIAMKLLSALIEKEGKSGGKIGFDIESVKRLLQQKDRGSSNSNRRRSGRRRPSRNSGGGGGYRGSNRGRRR